MSSTLVLFFVAVLCAASIQTMAGFGFALMMMPLAVLLLGVRTAAPLIALVGLAVSLVNMLRNRQSIDLRELRVMVLLGAVGIPFGVWALVGISERAIRVTLGVLLIVYGLASLLRPIKRPPISSGWAYPVAFLAGGLAGAYNLPGPVLVLYGSLRQWPHDKFRAMLQSFFTASYLLTTALHLAGGRLTPSVLQLSAVALPAFLLGILLGSRVDRRLDRRLLRAAVNVLIAALGVSLIL